MQRLVALIEQFRPKFSDTIRAAEPEAVEALAELAGPLPGAYVRFLHTMGADMGELALADADFRIEEQVGAYCASPWMRHPRFLQIAQDYSPASWDYYLDRDAPSGADDCRVVQMPLGKKFLATDQQWPLYAGLEEMLYVQAFRTLRLPLLAHAAEFMRTSTASGESEAVRAIAESFGFVRVAPEFRSALYERGDAAIVLYQHPVEANFSFRLACEDAGELARLSTSFIEQTGVIASPFAQQPIDAQDD